MTQLVIFDCDGVLVDSETLTQQALVDNLSRYGLTLTLAQVHDLFGGGTLAFAGVEATRRGATLPDHWLDEIHAQVNAAMATGVDVMPGLVSLLDLLDRAGIGVAVASNGPMEKMRHSLGPSGLWDRFDGRIFSAHDYAPKPDPAMLYQAIDATGASVATTIMVDDMPAGWNAARAADVCCYAYVADGGTARADGYAVKPITDLMQISRDLGLAD